MLSDQYEFGAYRLDAQSGMLFRDGDHVALPPKVAELLVALVEAAGRVLTREDLVQRLWPDTVVEEGSLTSHISLLRKALGEGPKAQDFIETLSKRGYRFVAEVREFEPAQGNVESRSATSRFGQAPSSSYSNHRTPAVASEVEANKVSEGYLHAGTARGRNGSGTHGRESSARRAWMPGLLGGLAIIAVVALLEWAGWRQKLFGESGVSPIRSIAVLPLQNLSDDANQEYFVDGMTDELITDLAQIRGLKVVSKTSIMQYKGTRTPTPQIGRELGVDAVVEGSVLRSGDRVRITAQLIRTATDRHVWAEAYDGDLKDVLSLQARVAEAITNQVKLNLTAEESGRLHSARAVNPEAFDLYLRGRYAWNQRNVEGFQKAIQYFNQAIEKDSNFALAYSGLADSYTLLALYGAGAPSITEAKAAAERALQLDSTLAEAHTSLAAVKILHDWDWQGAEREFHRALELNPNFAQAHHWYGNLLLGPEGRHEEGVAEMLRAQELDPLSPIIKADTGFAYFLAGRYDLALPAYQRVLAANPNFVPVHFYLSKYYRQTGQYDLWVNEMLEDYGLGGLSTRAQDLKQVYAQGGFQAVMEEMANPKRSSKLQAYKDQRLDSCASAEADAVLGRNVAALGALEECDRRSEIALVYLKVDPVWMNLRPEPRFQNLLRRLHLQ